MEYYSNLLNGVKVKDGTSFETYSPIDKSVIGTGYIVDADILEEVFKKTKPVDKTKLHEAHFTKLASLITDKKQDLINQVVLETGYTVQDCTDIVEGSVEFAAHFLENLAETKFAIPSSTFSYEHAMDRELRIIPVRAGVVSIMTPQNAPLILELTALLNALAAGNGVILRPSSQNVGTASKLIDLLAEAFPEEIMQSISIVSCKAPVFLDLSYRYANMIHYIGSSLHGKKILQDALETNCKVLVDGEGSSIVVVDKTANVDEAVNACRDGIIRCSGELCSTVRTILVDKALYAEFSKKLTEALDTVVIGDPRKEHVMMGPLFHEKQVENIQEIATKYSTVSNKNNGESIGPNYMHPILCELEEKDMGFVNEAFYGPLVGIAAYEGEDWKKWFKAQQYKLNSCVFSTDNNFIEEFIEVSQSPRVVINHDPSIESAFEPWGAFLPSGQNDVSYWIDKYRKMVQLDVPIAFKIKN